MKKSSLYILLAVLFFFSCKKEETPSIGGITPIVRMQDTLTKYQQLLSSAPYGWKGFVSPAGLSHSIYSFYFKFNDSNRVQSFSDFDSTSNVTMLESSYRLAAYNQPTLVFDTYTYLTKLADPDPSVNGGVTGSGLSSDFEFMIDSLVGDTLKLTGRYHQSEAFLVKATQAEADAFYNKTYGKREFQHYNDILTYFKRFSYGGVAYDVNANIQGHVISFTSIDASGNKQVDTTGFYYTPTGIALFPALVNGTTTITSFDNVTWNKNADALTFSVNGTASAITEIVVPVWVDVNAPQAWEAQGVQQNVWLSQYGFHVNGVDNAFGVDQIPNFNLIVYYAQPQGPSYDAFTAFRTITKDSSSLFGNAVKITSYTSDGRAIFRDLGALQTPAPTTDAAAIMAQMITQLTITRGYYFVQTGSASYDMVSAADGKAWLTWLYQ